MDIRYKTEYKFLDLHDLDENGKREINTILKTHVDSNFLTLPWEINENDIEYNEEKVDVPEPRKWTDYDVASGNYGNLLAPPNMEPYFPRFIPDDWRVQPNVIAKRLLPYISNHIMPLESPSFPPETIKMNDLLNSRSENRRSRGRNKRGGNDGFNNRQNHINHEMSYVAPEHSQMIPVMTLNPFDPEGNGNQQHLVTGQPMFTYSLGYHRPILQQPIYHHVAVNDIMVPYNGPKYAPLNVTVPFNGQDTYPMLQMRAVPPKDKHSHHRQNRRVRFNLQEEETMDSNPMQKIVTATTKVTVQNSQEEQNGQMEEKNLPVNVRIEHTVVSTINNAENKEKEFSKININSNIEVKQNGEEEVKIKQIPNELEIEEPIKSQKIENKNKTQNEVKALNEVKDQSEVKVRNELKAQSEQKKIHVETKSIQNTPPPPPMQITPVQIKPTFASMLKEGGVSGNTVKPTARINPINANKNTANNGVPSEIEKERIKSNNNNNNNNSRIVHNEPPVQQNVQKTNEDNYHNENESFDKKQIKDFGDDPLAYRMGEFLLNYQMDKQTVSLLPRGLTNRSNYCYINSILQALLACPPFYNLLMAMPYSKNTSKKISVSPLLDNMIRFVREFRPLSDGARLLNRKDRSQKRNENTTVDIQCDVPFEPMYVYTMLKNTSSHFSVEGRQEDAEEFLSCLLNGMSDEMLELMKIASNDKMTTEMDSNVNYSQGEEEWKVMGPKNKGCITRCTEFGRTPLSDIFRGQLRSKVSRSGEQSTDYVQPFFTLQLDIEKAESVQRAFEILVGKDQLEGMTCSRTKQQIEAWKQVLLEELPVILILHLKWFDYKLDGCSKILKQVEFPVNLKVDNKFLSPNALKKFYMKQRQYKLFAVTYHDGKEASKGHYVTDAFHVGYGGWVRYDDNSLKGVSEGNVLKPQSPRVPYLLYYRRQDTIGNSNNNNTNNHNQANNVRSR